MPATARLTVARAKGEIGTTEDPPGSNRTKYGRRYGMDGYAWCAMFIWWLLAYEGEIEHVKSAYTPTVADWYRKQGRFFTDRSEAELGDLIFFHNGSRISHIGILRDDAPEAGAIPTIEGNTSSGSSGSQDDGGGVFKRERISVSGFAIAGYAKPHYKPAPKKVEWTFPKRDWMGKGDRGADVKNWQRDLNAYFKVNGFAKPLEVTGIFNAETLKATKQFQYERNLDIDGRVGQKTLDVIERYLERRT